jgi:uncharacterized protein
VRGSIVGGGSYLSEGLQLFVLGVVDLDSEPRSAALIDMEFLAHGVSADPRQPTRIACFEKHGPGACYVDLRSGRAQTRIATARNRQFYGHGAFSTDGALLYATESYLDEDLRGALVVRDAATLAELGELPTYGTAPHDCLLIDDGATMVVTNGGGPLRGGDKPSITFVDLASERLLDTIALPQGRFNAGHLAMTRAGDIALVSAPREGLPKGSPQLGAVSLKPRGNPIATMRKPTAVVKRMKGETLSVAISPHDGSVMATHPAADMMTLWDLQRGKLLRRYDDLSGPNGVCVTLDGNHFVVSHAQDGRAALSLVDCVTRERNPADTVDDTMISGSHLFALDLSSPGRAPALGR